MHHFHPGRTTHRRHSSPCSLLPSSFSLHLKSPRHPSKIREETCAVLSTGPAPTFSSCGPSCSLYLLFSDAEHNNHYSNSRWLEFVTVEISLAFFVAELFTTLIFFPDTFIQDKGDLIHHVFGVVGLLISVY